MKPNYTYLGIVQRVKDGDTLEVALDVARGWTWTTGIRLNRYDCDELRDSDPVKRENARKATIALANLVGQATAILTFPEAQAVCGQQVSVRIVKPDKYSDRWISEVWILDPKTGAALEPPLSSRMLEKAAAGELQGVRPYSGGARDFEPENPFTYEYPQDE